MSLIDLSPPISEPVSLEEAKNFLKIDTDDDDNLVANLVSTIRHMVENRIGRSLINRSYIFRTNIPKNNCLLLPRPPLVSVLRISMIGENDQSFDIPPSDYSVNTKQEPGEIILKPGKNWHEYLSGFSSVEVEFIAGYGNNASSVPLPIRQAILLGLAYAYEYRATDKNMELPTMSDALLAPYKTVRL